MDIQNIVNKVNRVIEGTNKVIEPLEVGKALSKEDADMIRGTTQRMQTILRSIIVDVGGHVDYPKFES